jgi:copper chaperone CopZ
VSSVVVQLDGGAATVEYDPSVVSVDDLIAAVAGAPGMNGSAGAFQATAAD